MLTPLEIVVIVAVIVLVFGPSRLPRWVRASARCCEGSAKR
ncbi:twin-arginine translocase TatA/TatE family subunit [Nannocystis bainbridge]